MPEITPPSPRSTGRVRSDFGTSRPSIASHQSDTRPLKRARTDMGSRGADRRRPTTRRPKKVVSSRSDALYSEVYIPYKSMLTRRIHPPFGTLLFNLWTSKCAITSAFQRMLQSLLSSLILSFRRISILLNTAGMSLHLTCTVSHRGTQPMGARNIQHPHLRAQLTARLSISPKTTALEATMTPISTSTSPGYCPIPRSP
jgi:hypothetical protein